MNFTRMRAKLSSLSHLARWKSKEQREAWSFFKKLLFYPPWFLLLLVVCFTKFNYGGYQYKSSLEKLLVANLSTIHRVDQMWSWIQGQFLDTITGGSSWYNGQSSSLSSALLIDYSSYIVQNVLLRQIRVVESNCKYQNAWNRSACYSEYNQDNEETRNFSLYWQATSSSPSNLIDWAFIYTDSSSLNSHSYSTAYRTYSGGGYTFPIMPLYYTSSQILAQLQTLQLNEWIDEKTRAVFIQFTVYNANMNMFAHCIILFEMLPMGSIVISSRIIPVALYTFKSSHPGMIFLDVLYLTLTSCLILKELVAIIRRGRKYFSIGRAVTWLIVITSWISFGLFMLRLNEQNDLISKLDQGQVINFLTYEDLDTGLMLCMSVCCFLATIKLLEIASFNYHIGKMIRVIRNCAVQLVWFAFIYILLLAIFVNVAYVMNIDSVSSYTWSLMACVLAVTGHLKYATHFYNEGVLSLIVFILFVCVLVLAMRFLFISILSSSLKELRQKEKKIYRKNLHEWMDVLVDMLVILKNSPRDWLNRLKGIKKPKPPKRKDMFAYKSHLDVLEKRSDWLMNQVNNMHVHKPPKINSD